MKNPKLLLHLSLIVLILLLLFFNKYFSNITFAICVGTIAITHSLLLYKLNMNDSTSNKESNHIKLITQVSLTLLIVVAAILRSLEILTQSGLILALILCFIISNFIDYKLRKKTN